MTLPRAGARSGNTSAAVAGLMSTLSTSAQHLDRYLRPVVINVCRLNTQVRLTKILWKSKMSVSKAGDANLVSNNSPLNEDVRTMEDIFIHTFRVKQGSYRISIRLN